MCSARSGIVKFTEAIEVTIPNIVVSSEKVAQI